MRHTKTSAAPSDRRARWHRNASYLLVAALASTAIADPSSPPVKQVKSFRMTEGTPIWIELTPSDAFFTLDTLRERRHERTYFSVPLHDDARGIGNRLIFEELRKAYLAKTPIGVVWNEASADLSSYGPEWRRLEGHSYSIVQSVFNLTAESTEPYAAPPKAVTPSGEIKK